MFTNADVTMYLYSRDGKTEKYTRMPITAVYWEDTQQSTFLKTGQRDGCAVLLVIPLDSLETPVKFTKGKDLAVNGIVSAEIDSSSQEAMSKSLAALRSSHRFVTVVSVDERLYGSESIQHYELACK